MSAHAMDLDTFLGHTSSSAGGGSTFLDNWKKRNPPAINTVFHTRAPLTALWQHSVPYIQVLEKEGEPTRREAWGGTWNCIEPESILKNQYKTDRKTGERRYPPQICPACILIETIRGMVLRGEIGFTEKVFRWVGDDEDKARVITAAGMFNGYKENKMTAKQKAEMRKAGISPGDAWVENFFAKCNYLFVVVDYDNPGDGVQVTTETTSLGDKVKERIRDRMVAVGEDEGHPMKNPYVIRWEHHKAEKQFDKKYKAIVMPKLVITPEIERLIVDEEPPDVSGLIAPGNTRKLRADLEEHCLIDLPWDDIFGPCGATGDDGGEEVSTAEAEAAMADVIGDDDAAAPVSEELFACDACEAVCLTATDTQCKKCGARYTPDGQLIKDEPKKRSQAAPKKRSQAAAASAPAADDDPFAGDDIPF